MTALEIYRQDIADQEQGQALPRQQYFVALRDALHRELMQQGYSELLEQLLMDVRAGEMQRIYVLDYAVLMECHSMIIMAQKMRDASEYVPHLQLRGEKVRWNALESEESVLMSVTREITEKMRQLRSVSRQLVDARNDASIPHADAAAKSEIEQVHHLNKLLMERNTALQAERDELKERLRQAEEGVITEHVRIAIEGRRLQEEAALEKAFAGQTAAAREAFRRQYAEEQSAELARQEEAARKTAALREEAAKEAALLRQGMGEELRQLSRLIGGQIDRWQQALDRNECRLLARHYAALHDLWRNALPGVITQAQYTSADASVLEGLGTLQCQLRDKLIQLEQAMLRLGLTVIRPARGEAFDGALHVPVGTSQGAVGDSVIARCVHPGVRLEATGEALLRAEVELA